MEWAVNSAEGMVNYFNKHDLDVEDDNAMVIKFLPRYLRDAENWIRSFGHEPLN